MTRAPFEEPPTPGTSIADFLLARVPDTSGPSDPVHLLAAIDHFEELFTSFPARQAERGEFIDQLAAAVRRVSAIRLLIVINDEYLGELKAYERRLSPFPLEYIRLSSLSADTALDAITGPLRGTRRKSPPTYRKRSWITSRPSNIRISQVSPLPCRSATASSRCCCRSPALTYGHQCRTVPISSRAITCSFMVRSIRRSAGSMTRR